MDNDKFVPAFRAMVRVRQVFEDALSPFTSHIAIDLLLAAASWASPPKPERSLTVKQLFAQLPHSDRAVRIHFNRLVSQGLLATEPGRQDRRTKIVRLPARGESLLRRAASVLLQTLQRESRAAAKAADPARGSATRANGARASR